MKLSVILATSSLCLALIGCGGGGSEFTSTTDSKEHQTLDFNYQVTSLFQQSVNASTSRIVSGEPSQFRSHVTSAFTSDDIMTGELQVVPTNGGDSQTFTWSIYLDETAWTAESNLSIDLTPGIYDFNLLLEKDDRQYAATTTYQVIDGTNDVPMIISPVIGDLIVNVNMVDELADFKFQYDINELASLTNPQIGVQVDGASEQIFTLNPATGLSDAYLNLSDGNHTLELKLYDANIQVGKSIDAQETQVVVVGQDINMDFVPLHAETQLVLSEAGGDANVTVHLPQQVADEVGGINNLIGSFSIVGANNPIQQTQMTFNPVTNGYEANFVLTELQYDNLTVSLIFDEKDSGEQIASCNNVWVLNALSQTMNCNVELRRRAVIGGNLMAVLGINVINQTSEPVEGVVIKDQNDNILGITGSGTWGTKGYLKTYLKAGDYTITAEDPNNNLTGTENENLTPLEIENVLITLDQPIQLSGATCATIKANNPSASDGVYTIDPDGSNTGVDPFDAYCDMTTQGGGWTLVSIRQKFVELTANNKVTDLNSDIDALDDTNWMNLREKSSEMYFITDTGVWATSNISDLEAIEETPLSNTLLEGELVFTNRSLPYCYVGHSVINWVTNMVNNCSVPFFKDHNGLNVGVDPNKLYIYIR